MISKGDIVVLMRDNAGNFVRDFERFIGAVGEVVKVNKPPTLFQIVAQVKFDGTTDYDQTWYYDVRKLFKLGSVESEV